MEIGKSYYSLSLLDRPVGNTLAASFIKLCIVYFIQIFLYLELLHLLPKCVHV